MTAAPTDQPADYLAEFDRRWQALCVARTQTKPSAPARATREFPPHLRFGFGGNAFEYCIFGWNPPEGDFAWTSCAEAVLHLPPAPREEAYLLNMRVAPFVGGAVRRQRVTLSVAGELVAQWSISHPGHYFALLFDRHLGRSEDLVFHLPDGASPRDLGLNDDGRRLGLQVFDLWLTPWPELSL